MCLKIDGAVIKMTYYHNLHLTFTASFQTTWSHHLCFFNLYLDLVSIVHCGDFIHMFEFLE